MLWPNRGAFVLWDSLAECRSSYCAGDSRLLLDEVLFQQVEVQLYQVDRLSKVNVWVGLQQTVRVELLAADSVVQHNGKLVEQGIVCMCPTVASYALLNLPRLNDVRRSLDVQSSTDCWVLLWDNCLSLRQSWHRVNIRCLRQVRGDLPFERVRLGNKGSLGQPVRLSGGVRRLLEVLKSKLWNFLVKWQRDLQNFFRASYTPSWIWDFTSDWLHAMFSFSWADDEVLGVEITPEQLSLASDRSQANMCPFWSSACWVVRLEEGQVVCAAETVNTRTWAVFQSHSARLRSLANLFFVAAACHQIFHVLVLAELSVKNK